LALSLRLRQEEASAQEEAEDADGEHVLEADADRCAGRFHGRALPYCLPFRAAILADVDLGTTRPLLPRPRLAVAPGAFRPIGYRRDAWGGDRVSTEVIRPRIPSGPGEPLQRRLVPDQPGM